MAAATSAYLAGQDLVVLFLDDRCETGSDRVETASGLYAAWTVYAKAAGEVQGSQCRFAATLERHGLVRERTCEAKACIAAHGCGAGKGAVEGAGCDKSRRKTGRA